MDVPHVAGSGRRCALTLWSWAGRTSQTGWFPGWTDQLSKDTEKWMNTKSTKTSVDTWGMTNNKRFDKLKFNLSYLVVGGFGVSLNLRTDVEGSTNHACHVTFRRMMQKTYWVSGSEYSYQNISRECLQTLCTCWVWFGHHYWATVLHFKYACSLREISS